MKKIGLCLAYNGQNYGMLLQAYATQQILEKKGYSTEIIEYVAGKKRGVRITPGLFVFAAKTAKSKLKKKFSKREVIDKVHVENKRARKQVSDKFRAEHLHNIVKYSGIDALKNAGANNYDAVLVGSDQQWLPNVAFSNFRTMRFVPDNVLKMSYAASFGVSELPRYTRSSARQFLNRIDFISVREKTGKEIVENVSDNTAELVLDPTYLLTKEEWEERFNPKRIIEEPYVLCYFLGVDQNARNAAREYAEKRGLKLVSIMSDESQSETDATFADEIISGKGPEDFINLVRFADCVLTDSFHGTAFSIINKKQFFVFYRVRKGVASRNTRIDNILETFSLEDRLIVNSEDLNKPHNDIDYERVGQVLSERRETSLAFLDRALKTIN